MTKKEINILDRIWSFAVKERDNFTCRYTNCSNKNVDSHHIIKRQFRTLRWDLDNGLTLCKSHHYFSNNAAHVDELGFMEWMKENNINFANLWKRRYDNSNFIFQDVLLNMKAQAVNLNLLETIEMIKKYEGKTLRDKNRNKKRKKANI